MSSYRRAVPRPIIGMLSPLDGIFFCSKGAAWAHRSPEGSKNAALIPRPALRKVLRLGFIHEDLKTRHHGSYEGVGAKFSNLVKDRPGGGRRLTGAFDVFH